MGAYPGAGPRDSFESSNHRVVVDAARVPGLTGGATHQTDAGPPIGSPDDGGVRRYPSRGDVADDIGDYGRETRAHGFDDETTRAREPGRPFMEEPSSAYAAETASPLRRAADAPSARRAPVGAFPGHQVFPEDADVRDAFAMPRGATKKSFAVTGVDPIDAHFDPRAAREAALAEAERARFRAQLDEQVALKKRAEAERKRLETLAPAFGFGADPDDRDPDPDRGNARRSGDARSRRLDHSRLASSPRETMRGVPRRGVSPGNGDYSSPLARAGGGPSSFYLGGGDPPRGGAAAADGAFARFSDGAGAFADARASDAAEARRRQLVADLDAQVRAKREQKRLRELREALEDAKIERRIQEVVEQERLEREMKERLLDRSGDAPGEYRVANSPRASVADPGLAAGTKGAPPLDPVSDPRDSASAPDARADASALETVSSPAPRALPAEDDASALTPRRQLQRSPELGARRPSRAPKASRDAEVAAARALDYADAPGLEAHAATLSPAPAASEAAFPLGSPPRRGAPEEARAAAALDAKVETLRAELERRDVDLEWVRDEARRLERARDLVERERDLEHQLREIRSEMAAGVALGTFAAARAANVEDDDGGDPRGGSSVGADAASFVVRSGFVRLDAPIGATESPERRGGDFDALVPEGYAVRPREARGGGAPRIAGLQRRAARVAAEERGKGAMRAATKENDPGTAPHRPVWGANRAPNARASGGRAARGDRWS